MSGETAMLEDRVPVVLKGVYPHQEGTETTRYRVILRDGEQRCLEIFIGLPEAWALLDGIESRQQGKTWERPLTYEAMLACLSVAGATVEDVCICDLRDRIFFAEIRLRVGDRMSGVDARPSDALNLAVWSGCPLFVREEVLLAVQEGSSYQLVSEARQAVSNLQSRVASKVQQVSLPIGPNESTRPPATEQ